jgi:hypothetical protein
MGRNHPEMSLSAMKNADFFKSNPKNLAASLGKVN